jgi:hypothetical protein
MLELEPTEKEWLRLYSQGREAFRKGRLRSSSPRGGWQQTVWLEGFDAEYPENHYPSDMAEATPTFR